MGLFLALLILVSNVGVAFTMHYCGGKIASVSVQTIANTASSEKGCCEKKEISEDSCCKNKTIHFQKKSDNATLKAFSFEPFLDYLLPEKKVEIIFSSTTFITKSIPNYYCEANAPPLFKLYQRYIFYA
jgi:hypothetical protein